MRTTNSVYESLADSKDYLLLNYYESTEIFYHYHKAVEIVYCIEGKTDFFIDGHDVTLEENEIFFAPSFAIHNNTNNGHNLILSLVFSNDFLYDFEKSFPSKTLPNFMKDHEFNKRLLEYLKAFEKIRPLKHNELCRLQKAAFINTILWKLSQHYELKIKDSLSKDKKITNILCYLNEHFKEDITQDKLANHFGYNPQYLSRLFNKTMNCNLSTYINTLRIAFINESLKNNPTNKSLSEIIDESGFGSVATYYRVRAKCKPSDDKK